MKIFAFVQSLANGLVVDPIASRRINMKRLACVIEKHNTRRSNPNTNRNQDQKQHADDYAPQPSSVMRIT